MSVKGGTSWSNLAGFTAASFTAGPLAAFENGWEVRAVFTNSGGSATTNPATIHVS